MAKKNPTAEKPATPAVETEESATRVGPMHEAFAEFLNTEFDAGISPEQVFLVTSKRKAFRSTDAYRVGVRDAAAEAKAAEQAEKEKRAQEREAAKAAKEAEKATKAQEREAAKAAKEQERAEAKAAKEAEAAKAKAAEPTVTTEAVKPAKGAKKAAATPAGDGQTAAKPRAKAPAKAKAF